MKGFNIVESRTGYIILGALTISAAFVFGLSISDSANAENTPMITTVLGFFGLFIMSAVGKIKSAKRADNLEGKVDRVLNGEMDAKIARVVHQVMDERGLGDSPTDKP